MASLYLRKEKLLARKGYKIIVGIDEAGRGPLAGPITASALVVIGPISNFKFLSLREIWRSQTIFKQKRNKFYAIRDSKKLSEQQREHWYEILTCHPRIFWAVASVWPKTIDKINIARAANLAASRAFQKLIAKIRPRGTSREARQSAKVPERPSQNFGSGRSRNRSKTFVLLDGSLYLPQIPNPKSYILNSQTVIKGDEKIWSIAAASVIAKVTRDRLMRRLAKKFPEYSLETHKGYGTKLHYQKLKKHGPSEIHRKSFLRTFSP